jgi:drug/metabolite transporter (DMT)-like permease
MKSTAVVGVLLIVVGALILAYQGFTYTTHKKVVDIGPVQATKKEHKTVALPPILGAVALAGGVVLIAVGSRKS